jgi:hypothetical protein
MRRETASNCYYLGERAIVVGGGLGGLSAARALSDRFRQVEFPGQDPWPRIKFDWPTYAMSRPLIELTLRRQVQRLRNVKVQGQCRVLNIIGESNTGAATGICYRTPDGNVETLQSDLIIDASGNGSLTLDFLKASGRSLPEETSLLENSGSPTPVQDRFLEIIKVGRRWYGATG